MEVSIVFSRISPEYRGSSENRVKIGRYRVAAAIMALGLIAAAIPAFGKALDEGCVKFEGSQLGVEGVSQSVEGMTVTLTGWDAKAGEDDEYIAFSYSVTGGEAARVAVKAGRTTFDAPDPDPAAGTYSFPTDLEKVRAISNIVVCVDEIPEQPIQ